MDKCKKRIVFVIAQLHGGGAERVTAALANEMSKNVDREIHVVTYSEKSEREFSLGTRVIRHSISTPKVSRVKTVAARVSLLKRLIQKIRPDCVISLGGPSVLGVLTAAMFGSGIPLILSERNDPKRYPDQVLLRIVRFAAFSFCDKIVFQTHEAKSYFPSFMRKKGVVIPNPLTEKLPERFHGVRANRIVNFCRLNAQKNLDLLIDAFSDIAAEFPQHSLHIYGDGPERGRLEKKVQTMGLAECVTLHGYSSRIYDEIVDAALFVSSSNYEGISNSMLEAIALGIPSICTDCPAGGARETIVHEKNGMLVPVGDRKELAEAMRRVLNDKTLADSMGVNGSELRNALSAQVVTRKWTDMLESIGR